MLVPLTASLYVPGKFDDAEKVLVDVGTGYFIEVLPVLLLIDKDAIFQLLSCSLLCKDCIFLAPLLGCWEAVLSYCYASAKNLFVVA